MKIDRIGIVGNFHREKCSIPLRQEKQPARFDRVLRDNHATAATLGMKWHGRRFQIGGNAALGTSCFPSLSGSHSLWGGWRNYQAESNPSIRFKSWYGCGSKSFTSPAPRNWKASDLQDDQRTRFKILSGSIGGLRGKQSHSWPSIFTSNALGRRKWDGPRDATDNSSPPTPEKKNMGKKRKKTYDFFMIFHDFPFFRCFFPWFFHVFHPWWPSCSALTVPRRFVFDPKTFLPVPRGLRMCGVEVWCNHHEWTNMRVDITGFGEN